MPMIMVTRDPRASGGELWRCSVCGFAGVRPPGPGERPAPECPSCPADAPRCGQRDCVLAARVEVWWPTGWVRCCRRCARGVARVAEALGMADPPTRDLPGALALAGRAIDLED